MDTHIGEAMASEDVRVHGFRWLSIDGFLLRAAADVSPTGLVVSVVGA